MFHIWQIGNITEGIEILTGVNAGNKRDENGRFPEDSIFAKIENRFNKMYDLTQKTKERVLIKESVK